MDPGSGYWKYMILHIRILTSTLIFGYQIFIIGRERKREWKIIIILLDYALVNKGNKSL